MEANADYCVVNMKATIGWCVHGFLEKEQNPNTTLAMSSCAGSCDSISTAIADRLLQTNETLQYNYCTSDDGVRLPPTIKSIQ